jgi:hypothetical protein
MSKPVLVWYQLLNIPTREALVLGIFNIFIKAWSWCGVLFIKTKTSLKFFLVYVMVCLQNVKTHAAFGKMECTCFREQNALKQARAFQVPHEIMNPMLS